MTLQGITDFITGKDRQKEVDLYNQYWNKVKTSQAMDLPTPNTKNPDPTTVNNFLGISEKPKGGLSKLLELFSSQNNSFHSPIPVEASGNGLSKINPTPTQVMMPEMNEYEEKATPTFKKYELPNSVVLGIGAAENGFKNKFNIGATDSNPTGAPIMDDLESATAAAKLLTGKYKLENGNIDERYKPAFNKYKQTGNEEQFLKDIENLGYAGDSKTWKERSIKQGGAGKYYDKWSDFVMDTPAFKKWKGIK
jgi:hypothetical protein